MRKWPGWLIAFNVLGFMLMCALMLMWIMVNSEAYQRRRAQSAALAELKRLGLPGLPEKAIVIRGSEEETRAERVTMLTFEAPSKAIRVWLRQGKTVLVPDEDFLRNEAGVLKYRFVSPLGYPLGSSLTFDEQNGRVDVRLTERTLSL